MQKISIFGNDKNINVTHSKKIRLFKFEFHIEIGQRLISLLKVSYSGLTSVTRGAKIKLLD